MSGARSLPTLRRVLAGVHFRVTLFAVAMAGITVMTTGIATMLAVSRDNLRLVAQSVSYTVAPAVIFHDAQAAREGLAPLAANGVAEIRVTLPDGRVFARWQRPAQDRSLLGRPIAALFLSKPATAPVSMGDSVVARVAVTGDARDIAGYIESGILGALACLIATAIATGLLTRRLQRSVIDPLSAIAEVTHAVRTERAFERRAPPSTIAEIDTLSGDLNGLLAELDAWEQQLRSENERLSHSAAHDALTGLPNRRQFEQRLTSLLTQARANGQSFALLYIDGNNFKAINDRYGHRAGDAVLIEIAARLRRCLRSGDVAARLGGDEFGLLLAPDAGRDAAARVRSAIVEAMRAPVALPSGEAATVSVSVGAAIFPDDGLDAAALTGAADAGMYAAKQRSDRPHFLQRKGRFS